MSDIVERTKYEDIHTEEYIDLVCPYDNGRVVYQNSKNLQTRTKNGYKVDLSIPFFRCATCGKEFVYSKKSGHQVNVSISGHIYENLVPQKSNPKYKNPNNVLKPRIIKKGTGYIYGTSVTECINRKCDSQQIKRVECLVKDNDGNLCVKQIRQCCKCKAYFIPVSIIHEVTFPFPILNTCDMVEFEKQYNESLVQKAEKRKEKQAKIEAEAERLRMQEAEQKQRDLEERKRISEERNNAIFQLRGADSNRNAAQIAAENDITVITAKDFLIRRSVFKCMHDGHSLKDIVARVTIFDSEGMEHEIKIETGYCSDCKMYFILDSTYERIKELGVPNCRISDEKLYLKEYDVNGMKLAAESVLKQYGYNVSNEDDLSEVTRHCILASIIDRKILTKSEIISYIDFFISQRRTQTKYDEAVKKWKADRKFVRGYKIGDYLEYGVKSFYRK